MITRKEVEERMRGREHDWSNYKPTVTLEECEMDDPCRDPTKTISCSVLMEYLSRDK